MYAVYNEFKNVMVQKLCTAETAADRSGCGLSPSNEATRSWLVQGIAEHGGFAADGACRLGQTQFLVDYIYEAAGGGDFQRPCAALSGGGSFPDSARIGGSRARRAHDGDGFGDAQRVGTDRQADACR